MKTFVLFGLIAAALAAPVADADADNVVVAHHAAVAPLTYAGFPAVAHHAAVAPVSYAAAAPAALTYAHAPAAFAPSAVTYAHAPAAVGPSGVTYAHAPAAVAPAAVTYAHAPAAVTYAHAPAAVAPAAVTYAHAPAAVAPAAVTYAHAAPVAYQAVAHQVALPPKEVQVPVTSHQVEIPVHQQVHYGTQAYVAGATTSIHKPSLAAPAIAPPSTLLSKVRQNPAELTIQTQEIPVEKHIPNFVDTPYHAGTIVKYTEPEIKEVKVPTPYAQPVAVPHPVPVAAPYAVPHPVPVTQEVHSVAVHQAVPVVHQAVHHAVPVVQHAALVKAAY